MNGPDHRNEPAPPRLFLALWPDDATRERLSAAQRQLYDALGGRKVPPENWHLTLAFLGPAKAGVAGVIMSRAARIAQSTAPFTLSLDIARCRPESHAGMAAAMRCPAELAALVTQLRAALQDLPVKQESRDFKPHVTLLRRVDKPYRAAIDPILWNCSGMVLAESVLDPEQAHYRIRRTLPFPLLKLTENV